MEMIRQWALSLCLAAVAGAMANILLPEGSIQKVFKMSFSVFFLCCLFSPLAMDIDVGELELAANEQTDTRTKELSQAVDRQVADGFARELEAIALAAMEKLGIAGAKAEADVNITDGDGIIINRLGLTLPEGCGISAEEAKAALEKELGLAVEVEVSGD